MRFGAPEPTVNGLDVLLLRGVRPATATTTQRQRIPPSRRLWYWDRVDTPPKCSLSSNPSFGRPPRLDTTTLFIARQTPTQRPQQDCCTLHPRRRYNHPNPPQLLKPRRTPLWCTTFLDRERWDNPISHRCTRHCTHSFGVCGWYYSKSVQDWYCAMVLVHVYLSLWRYCLEESHTYCRILVQWYLSNHCVGSIPCP